MEVDDDKPTQEPTKEQRSRKHRRPIDDWNGVTIPPGTERDIRLPVSESYSGMTLRIPLHVRRAKREGPAVFITAALHGDEINGTGAIRQLMNDPDFHLECGSIVFVPVLNLLAFDRHSRYLPDRRDLNRSFPGSASGSLASRMARVVFDEIVSRCDFGIDLHTAAVRRTNFPNVRGNLADSSVRRMCAAFGCEVIMDGKGPRGALRREACDAGCPTIVMEGGEVWKVEPGIVETAVRGVKNVLRLLGMCSGEIVEPAYQVCVQQTRWIRAERGGFLDFHVQPGELIEAGQPLATNNSLLGKELSVLTAPFSAVVIGMTTLPAISPGDPICHLGRLPADVKLQDLRDSRGQQKTLGERVEEDLATNLLVTEPNRETSAEDSSA